MGWVMFHKIVEGEEKQAIEVCSAIIKKHRRRKPCPKFTAAIRIAGEVDSCSIGKEQLVSDKDRVGKMLVGRIESFVQLAPDVSATVIGANTGTLKLGIAVCTERALLDSTATDKDWQQQAY